RQPVVRLDKAEATSTSGPHEPGLVQPGHFPRHRRLRDPGRRRQLRHRPGLRRVDEEFSEQVELMLGTEEREERGRRSSRIVDDITRQMRTYVWGPVGADGVVKTPAGCGAAQRPNNRWLLAHHHAVLD